MSLGLLNDSLNPYRQYSFLFGLWVWISHTLGDSNTVTSCCFDNQDDRWRQPSAASPSAWSIGREITTGWTTYWIVSGSYLKGLQQKGQRESLPQGRLDLSCQATHDHDTQDQRQISTKVGRAICSRDSLLKRSLSPCKSKRRHARDADQRQILEEILSMITLTLYLWSLS